MIRSILVGAMVASMSLVGSAQEKQEKDFFDEIMAERIKECKPHFDIEPYFILAIGADHDERINESVLKSLEDFSTTGRLIVPQNKKNNPVAVSCATYAEGMMAGGTGAQLVIALGEAMSEGLGKAIEAIGKGIGEAFNQGLTQDDKK